MGRDLSLEQMELGYVAVAESDKTCVNLTSFSFRQTPWKLSGWKGSEIFLFSISFIFYVLGVKSFLFLFLLLSSMMIALKMFYSPILLLLAVFVVLNLGRRFFFFWLLFCFGFRMRIFFFAVCSLYVFRHR